MAIPGQPTDTNFLSPLGYKFVMSRLPNLEYFVQTFNFPALTLNETQGIQTPFNKLVIAGDHMTFDHFSLTFKIDENMYSYFELYDWMVAVGKPETFDQYAAIAAAGKTSGKGVLSDASLVILNGTMNPNIRIDFFDVLPVRISDFTFNSKETDVNYITATAEFKYREYTYTRLT